MSTHQPDDKREQRQTSAASQPGGPGTVPDSDVLDVVETEVLPGKEPNLKDDKEESEALDEALDDSFPASDPPAQTAKISKA